MKHLSKCVFKRKKGPGHLGEVGRVGRGGGSSSRAARPSSTMGGGGCWWVRELWKWLSEVG